jgi:hypothetical protein
MSTSAGSTFCAMSDALSVPDCDPLDGEGSAGMVEDPLLDDAVGADGVLAAVLVWSDRAKELPTPYPSAAHSIASTAITAAMAFGERPGRPWGSGEG